MKKISLNFFVSKLVGLHIFAAAYTAGAAVDHMQGLRGSFKMSKILARSLSKNLKVMKILRNLGQDQ